MDKDGSPEQPARDCPSARCEDGAVLLGIVGGEGRLGYVVPRTTIDAEFCKTAQAAGAPEARFRFAQPCAECQCTHWSGTRCRLILQILESPDAVPLMAAERDLPACAIRRSCRWFAETGSRACAICPWVVHSPAGRNS
jgi:hypothetical protein